MSIFNLELAKRGYRVQQLVVGEWVDFIVCFTNSIMINENFVTFNTNEQNSHGECRTINIKYLKMK